MTNFNHRPVNFLSVWQEAFDDQAVFICFQGEIIVCLRLGSCFFVQGVVNPQAGIAHVACHACEDIKRAVIIPLEVADMSTVAVGVQMGRKDYCNV